MSYFDHEQLDVYQAAIELVVLIDKIAEQLPRGRAYLVDQIQRASSSVVLNIAEGAGEFSTNEKNRFYRMAKRSATECAGILDIGRRLNLIEERSIINARGLLLRIVSMLTKMVRASNNDGQGHAHAHASN